MPEYLSKEEIKQWRSSLEKITLEEYAARLGKVLEEEKQTNDLVDIVMHNQPVVTTRIDSSYETKAEKLSTIANRAFEREREITQKPARKRSSVVSVEKETGSDNTINEKADIITETKAAAVSNQDISVKEKVQLTFSKALTEREQLVFDYFLQNKGKIVYAKELAGLLNLPRDYVYKYIKNLRAKIEGDKLENAENGGYILNV